MDSFLLDMAINVSMAAFEGHHHQIEDTLTLPGWGGIAMARMEAEGYAEG